MTTPAELHTAVDALQRVRGKCLALFERTGLTELAQMAAELDRALPDWWKDVTVGPPLTWSGAEIGGGHGA